MLQPMDRILQAAATGRRKRWAQGRVQGVWVVPVMQRTTRPLIVIHFRVERGCGGMFCLPSFKGFDIAEAPPLFEEVMSGRWRAEI
jgi:hypothetical protein